MQKKKYYIGEIGELYGVKFLPSYCQGWSNLKTVMVLTILNLIPSKLAHFIEYIFLYKAPKNTLAGVNGDNQK